MKTMILATVAALSLSAGATYAQGVPAGYQGSPHYGEQGAPKYASQSSTRG
jgi:hypothetical protein